MDDQLSGAIIVLAHQRVTQLEKCLTALENADNSNEFPKLVVVDGGNDAVEQLSWMKFKPDFHLRIKPNQRKTSRARILESLRCGLSWAFDVQQADYVVVIEDDIIIARDFLTFVDACMKENLSRPLFRAVNGFGVAIREESPSDEKTEICRLNYGVGWGWALPARTYRAIRPLLSIRGDYHVWDSLIEPYIRTGFVVNPVVSKILNLGFDSTATHTDASADLVIGQALSASFASNRRKSVAGIELAHSKAAFKWREDAISLDSLSPQLRVVTYATGLVLFLAHFGKLILEERGLEKFAGSLRKMTRFLRKRTLPYLGKVSGSSSIFGGGERNP